MPRPRLFPLALALSFVASTALSAPLVYIDDPFDNDDPTGIAARPQFWNLQTIGGENGIYERNGFLTLLASGFPYSYACLNSRLAPELNFFRHTVSLSVHDVVQNSAGVKPSESFFRLSINSTEKRQTASLQSISLRFCPGEIFLGYKTAAFGKADAENMQGARVGSVWRDTYDGDITALTLSLDPYARPGLTTCTVTLFTTGERPVITTTQVFDIPATSWSANGDSAIVLETRRNAPGKDDTSYVSTSLSRLVVTSSR